MGFLGFVMRGEGGVLDFWDFVVHNVSHYVSNGFSTCFPSFQDVIPNNTRFLPYIIFLGWWGIGGFGERGAVGGGLEIFGFLLFTMCSHHVLKEFPMCFPTCQNVQNNISFLSHII